jgi:CBS domain-containing protein
MKSIGELLTGRDVLTVTGDWTAFDAARAMQEHHVGAVVVLTDDGGLCGIFTERDLMTRVVVPGRDASTVKLEEVMTCGDLYFVAPDRRVNEVAREMQTRHIRHLPVVDDGRLIGVLSLRDLLREHLEIKRHEVEALKAYIQGDPEATDS